MPNIPRCLLVALLILPGIASCTRDAPADKAAARHIAAAGEPGLQPVDCWFGDDIASARCYRMWVPEIHGDPQSRLINFPVVVIRGDSEKDRRPPLLHLGAGGPGAPMYLDESLSIEYLLTDFSHFTLQQGRDLIVVDPRGSGLAEPLLACRRFIDNERRRLRQNLDPREYMLAVAADDQACIDDFLAQGVDLSAYNSLSVARDMEALREALGIPGWVLYGVSYAANYALAIADEYPDRVASMVLDSAYVSRVPWHEYYLDSITRPYRYLYDYCSLDIDCRRPEENIRERFWALTEKLESDPVRLAVEVEPGGKVELLLDGDRFNAALINGIYDAKIFSDFPRIVSRLEQGDYSVFEPYLQAYVGFLLDPDWGDISQMAHYCADDKPAVDFARIETLIEQLPAGFIRDNARVGFDWPDQCGRMGLGDADLHSVPSRKLDIPVLFVHGQLDLVTPVGNVRKIAGYFENFHLLVFDVGHGVLGSSTCAHVATNVFLRYPFYVETEFLTRYCGDRE